MATLGDILQLLPDVGRERLAYNPTFWVLKANAVLDEIEVEVKGSTMKAEAFIPVSARKTRYAIPSCIRKVTRLRLCDESGLLDLARDSLSVRHSITGDGMIQLQYPIGVDATVASIAQSISSKTALRAPAGSNLTAPVSEGWGAIVRHMATGDIEYRRVLGINADIWNQVDLDGDLKEFALPSDGCSVFDKYMIVEGRCKLKRFETAESLSPLPDEWNRVITLGLRWFLEAQSDEDGSGAAAQKWQSDFEEAMAEMEDDSSEIPSDEARIEPRRSLAWERF